MHGQDIENAGNIRRGARMGQTGMCENKIEKMPGVWQLDVRM
jgi:hypothetical protein